MTARFANLGPAEGSGWTVVVPAPGPWLRAGELVDRQHAYAWRQTSERAVRDAGVPPLRSVEIVAEIRPGPEVADPIVLGRWLPTARACALGVGDACGVIHGVITGAMPRLRLGPRSTSPGGEVVLHITGEVRS